jgi:hypothetical protein
MEAALKDTFAPVQDEFLFDRRERHNDFWNFCLYRIYRTNDNFDKTLVDRACESR